MFILSVPCQWVLTAPRSAFYQKKLNPEYNISLNPSAPMSGRKHSEETKTIMSEAKKGMEKIIAMKLNKKYLMLKKVNKNLKDHAGKAISTNRSI
jgi:hypothetical protein